MTVDVVVPTTGRSSLGPLLAALAAAREPRPRTVLLVDDRRDQRLPLPAAAAPGLDVRLLRGRGRGAGGRPQPGLAGVDRGLGGLPGRRRAAHARLAGAAGRRPGPPGRRPTDWERAVAGLEAARWATADMAYRRRALAAAGGFDERFGRAYREDADPGLRLLAAGWGIAAGDRRVVHPVPAAPPWVSLGRQAGNADDVLMRVRHGRSWRRRAQAPAGRRPRHLAVTAAGILPGPRTPAELLTMLLTSLALPPLASGHWLRGLALHLPPRRTPGAALGRPSVVLFGPVSPARVGAAARAAAPRAVGRPPRRSPRVPTGPGAAGDPAGGRARGAGRHARVGKVTYLLSVI